MYSYGSYISYLCLTDESFLVWQILDDPSPSPSKLNFSPEFCSFINACLQKDADARPTAEQVSKWQKLAAILNLIKAVLNDNGL